MLENKADASVAIISRQMNRGPLVGAPKILTYGMNNGLLGFVEGTEEQKQLRIFEKIAQTGMWREIFGARMFFGAIKDFSFTILSNGTLLLETLGLHGQNLASAFYHIEQNGDKINSLWNYTFEENAVQTACTSFFSGDTLVRVIDGNTYVVNPRIKKGTKLAGASLSKTQNSRGLFIVRKDGGVFACLAADEPAPPPAL
jgi:hypothetical protein